MKKEPVIIESKYNTHASKVWSAITDKDKMKKWYFDIDEFRPEPGFEFRFTAGTETRQYVHVCIVKEVIPDTKISYHWKFEGYPGNSLVTWEIFGEGNRSRLRLTHSGLETFPSENPDFARENFVTGWADIISNSLKLYLEESEVRA